MHAWRTLKPVDARAGVEYPGGSRMRTWVLLLRGINVGGRNALPMRTLVELLEDLGCRKVRTYIQSGNAVLESPQSGEQIARMLKQRINAAHGFEPGVLVLEPEQLERAIAGNPFPDAETDPKHLHLAFLEERPAGPDLDLDQLESLAADSERFSLEDRVFYLHAPEGIGRSKLAARREKVLGVAMTDRNWRTLCQLRDMVRSGMDQG